MCNSVETILVISSTTLQTALHYTKLHTILYTIHFTTLQSCTTALHYTAVQYVLSGTALDNRQQPRQSTREPGRTGCRTATVRKHTLTEVRLGGIHCRINMAWKHKLQDWYGLETWNKGYLWLRNIHCKTAKARNVTLEDRSGTITYAGGTLWLGNIHCRTAKAGKHEIRNIYDLEAYTAGLETWNKGYLWLGNIHNTAGTLWPGNKRVRAAMAQRYTLQYGYGFFLKLQKYTFQCDSRCLSAVVEYKVLVPAISSQTIYVHWALSIQQMRDVQ